MLNPDSCYYIY